MSPGWRGPVLAGAAAPAIAAVAWFVAGRTALNYDTAYGLVWGDQLLRQGSPDYEAFGSPTPHPALLAAGAIAAALGPPAAEAVTLVGGALLYGVLLVAAFVLARTLHSTLAGVVTVVVLAASGTLLVLGVTAAKDVPYVALVLVALKLEADRPRRGVPVLALLAVAGLIRPDAWGLSAAYWVWLLPAADRGRRVATAVLAAAGPAVWIIGDALVTGRPLFSFTYTRDLAEVLGRGTGAGNVPRELAGGLDTLLGLPGIVLGLVGAAVLLRRGGHGGRAVVAVVAILIGGFVVQGLGELPLTARVLLLPATLLAVCAGVGAADLVRAARARSPVPAVVVAGALAAVVLVSAAMRVQDARALVTAARTEGRLIAGLTDLLGRPPASRTLAACPRIAVALMAGPPGALQVPYLALWFHRHPDAIVPLDEQPPDPGAVLLPKGTERGVAGLPRSVDENRSWRLYAGECGSRSQR